MKENDLPKISIKPKANSSFNQ